MAFLMPLLGGLLSICSSMVGRVLLALGFGYATFKGMSLTTDWLLNNIKSNMSGMPYEVISFVAWLWVDKAIAMVFSAYTAALSVKLAGGSSITKFVLKGPAA